MKILNFILIVLFILLITFMLSIYYFTSSPAEIDLTSKNFSPKNSNFSLSLPNSSKMQFYDNMRYLSPRISYKISNLCTLQKKADVERAFEILEEETILDFYPVTIGEEISIACEDKQRIKEDFFVAGEGGPVNITKSGKFNLILYGEIVLIRDSKCPEPNVAIHEILHALGFDHSSNEESVMYPISECSQNLGEDIPEMINQIYSIPNYPDLIIEDLSPYVHGKYLDFNITIKNGGLRQADNSTLKVYVDENLLETIDVQILDVGFGMKLLLQNVNMKKTDFTNLKFIVESEFEELDKKNNEIVFEKIN